MKVRDIENSRTFSCDQGKNEIAADKVIEPLF